MDERDHEYIFILLFLLIMFISAILSDCLTEHYKVDPPVDKSELLKQESSR